jgi:hypothetical protein
MVAAATLAAACALVAPTSGRAARTCAASSYSYAGVVALKARYGIGATITALDAPTVRGGHVAAWVGVGGEGQGPNGSTEWLQAGISAEPNKGDALYYELALPGHAPKYVMLKGHLRAGASYRVAVIESRAHPSSWYVAVNGTRLTKAFKLPGSRDAWRPIATSESWDGDVGACNDYRFGFANVTVASQLGRHWLPIQASVMVQPGYSISRGRGLSSFIASATA